MSARSILSATFSFGPLGNKGRSDMTAQIVQTNNTPFRDVKVDPITLDIIENALRNARTEMDAVLFRTASISVRALRSAFSMMSKVMGSTLTSRNGVLLV